MSRRLIRPSLWLCGLGVSLAVGLTLWHRLAPGRPAPGAPPEVTTAADLPLNEAERKYLWEVEHNGQLLSQVGFKQFTKALGQADHTALLALLADDFEGSIFRAGREVRAPGDVAHVVRRQDAGTPPQKLGRDEFVGRLLEYRREFAQAPQAQLSLMTLSPRSREQLDGVWEAACVLRLWGESRPHAPAEVTVNVTWRLPRPTEELFAGRHWLKGCAITQEQAARAPRYLMREVAAERGIDTRYLHDNWTAAEKQPGITGGVYLCDYNRDGYLDMLVQDNSFGCILCTGRPTGKFRTRHLAPPVQCAAFGDFDGDGWDDLLLGGRIYPNRPDGKGGRTFTADGPNQRFLIDVFVSGVQVADYDRDGRLDIYFTRSDPGKAGSWVTGEGGNDRTNRLFRNKGGLEFEDVTERSGAGWPNHSCFSAAWLDADNDGWPDLYVINEYGNGVLLRNQGNGTFREHRLADGPMDFGSMGVAAGDIDNDGHVDIYCANMYSKAGKRVMGNLRPDAYPPDLMARMRRFVAGSQLWRNRGGLKFEPKAADWQLAGVGWAYGAQLADLDNDGYLDIYATAGFYSADRSEPDG